MPNRAKRSLKRKRPRVRSTRRVGGMERVFQSARESLARRFSTQTPPPALPNPRGAEELDSDSDDDSDTERLALSEMPPDAESLEEAAEALPVETSVYDERAEEERRRKAMEAWIKGIILKDAATEQRDDRPEVLPAVSEEPEDAALPPPSEEPEDAALPPPSEEPERAAQHPMAAHREEGKMEWFAKGWVVPSRATACTVQAAEETKEKTKGAPNVAPFLNFLTKNWTADVLMAQYDSQKSFCLNFSMGICALSEMFFSAKLKMLPASILKKTGIRMTIPKDLVSNTFKIIDQHRIDLIPELIRQANLTTPIKFDNPEAAAAPKAGVFGSMMGRSSPVQATLTCQFSFLAFACYELLSHLSPPGAVIDTEDLNKRLLPNLVQFVECGARFNLDEIRKILKPANTPPRSDAGATPLVYLITGIQDMCGIFDIDYSDIYQNYLSGFVIASFEKRGGGRTRRSKRKKATRRVLRRRLTSTKRKNYNRR